MKYLKTLFKRPLVKLAFVALGLSSAWAYMAISGPSAEVVQAVEKRLAQGQLVAQAANVAGLSETAPVVIELFTSQGCSSCPPADALLSELADQPGIIALSYHVDYWDYIGWKDPFSSPEATQRQRDYGSSLSLRYVYTPQLVIDGRRELVGSRRGDVLLGIEEAAKAGKAVSLSIAGNTLSEPTVSFGKELPLEGSATLWVAVFDEQHETEIQRGENKGLFMVNKHVVRGFERAAEWNGTDASVSFNFASLGLSPKDGYALLLQDGIGGAILGAVLHESNPG
ncbi:DUF1223 domain-containing protein [Kiloniella majae]|uniref:DUF1223 domain-containing protein n=1 Tax=Kiloniella majae TaxID=1938558 RepID=UPI000A277017|nr:DUF1223 domain-containing protein [Kiloniella majae]